MAKGFQYREYPVSPDLSPYVKCYWTCGGRPQDGHIRYLLPDGCVDVILNGSGKFYYQNSSQNAVRPETVGVLGTQTGPCRLGPCGTEEVHGFGIRFQPGAVFSALHIAAEAFQDGFATLPENTILPAGLPDRILSSAISPAQHIPLVSQALRERIKKGPALHPGVIRSVRLIQESQGQIRAEALCDQLSLTRQHLSRLFLKHVGVNPKTFARIVRFNALKDRLNAANREDACALAYDFGYYDQSHLISEFKEFSGCTPSQFSEEMFHFSNTALPDCV